MYQLFTSLPPVPANAATPNILNNTNTFKSNLSITCYYEDQEVTDFKDVNPDNIVLGYYEDNENIEYTPGVFMCNSLQFSFFCIESSHFACFLVKHKCSFIIIK